MTTDCKFCGVEGKPLELPKLRTTVHLCDRCSKTFLTFHLEEFFKINSPLTRLFK